jgi:hypothetical protein
MMTHAKVMFKNAAEKITNEVVNKHQGVIQEIVERLHYNSEMGYLQVDFTMEYDYSVCSFLELEIAQNFLALSGYKCKQEKNGDFVISFKPSELWTKYKPEQD